MCTGLIEILLPFLFEVVIDRTLKGGLIHLHPPTSVSNAWKRSSCNCSFFMGIILSDSKWLLDDDGTHSGWIMRGPGLWTRVPNVDVFR